jgi:hypothetical protein
MLETTPHRSPGAARVAAHYRRRKSGRIVLPVEVDEVGLVELLVEARLLSAGQQDDRRAVAAATSKLLGVITDENRIPNQ